MTSANDVVRYVVEVFYDGDAGAAAQATGFTKAQIVGWINDQKKPQKYNVGWLLNETIAPEFRVVAEYQPIDLANTEQGLRNQLKNIINAFEKSSGIYAFDDSMANLIYIGKSKGNLMDECYQQLRKELKGKIFPPGAKQPNRRGDIVRYISCYSVKDSNFMDHAKHIESLILRISKPRLNTNIGKLEKATAPT